MNARNRNKLCPCGSGLKTKNCHQSAAVHNAAKKAIEEAQREHLATLKIPEGGYVSRHQGFPLDALLVATGMMAGTAAFVKKDDFR